MLSGCPCPLAASWTPDRRARKCQQTPETEGPGGTYIHRSERLWGKAARQEVTDVGASVSLKNEKKITSSLELQDEDVEGLPDRGYRR